MNLKWETAKNREAAHANSRQNIPDRYDTHGTYVPVIPEKIKTPGMAMLRALAVKKDFMSKR